MNSVKTLVKGEPVMVAGGVAMLLQLGIAAVRSYGVVITPELEALLTAVSAFAPLGLNWLARQRVSPV